MEEMKASESNGESEKMGRTDFTTKLRDCQEMGTLTEREDYDDDLKMQLENLQNERDQLRNTVQETINMVRIIILFL